MSARALVLLAFLAIVTTAATAARPQTRQHQAQSSPHRRPRGRFAKTVSIQQRPPRAGLRGSAPGDSAGGPHAPPGTRIVDERGEVIIDVNLPFADSEPDGGEEASDALGSLGGSAAVDPATAAGGGWVDEAVEEILAYPPPLPHLVPISGLV